MKKFFIVYLASLILASLQAGNISFNETYYMLKRGDIWDLTVSVAEKVTVELRCERSGKTSTVAQTDGKYRIQIARDGFYTILVKDSSGTVLKSHEVAVVSRIPDLVFWDCPVSQRYVTDRQIWPKKDGQNWLKRQVSNLNWAPGRKGHPAGVTAMTQKYVDRMKNFDGILIDEFYMVKNYYPYQLDTVCPAIRAAAKQQPNKKIYVWITTPDPTCTVINETIKETVSLALIEVYIADFTSYKAIAAEFELAKKSGWADKAIIGLGIGSKWITTGKEAFRQIREVKMSIPEIRGIGFFGGGNNAIVMRGIDEGIRQYFIMPVIMYKTNGKSISNFGSMEAQQLEIIYCDGSKEMIASLPVGKTLILNKEIARVSESKHYTILEK